MKSSKKKVPQLSERPIEVVLVGKVLPQSGIEALVRLAFSLQKDPAAIPLKGRKH